MKPQPLVFAVVQQAKTECVALRQQQLQEAGAIIVAHILDRYVNTELRHTLPVIAEHAQAWKPLQIHAPVPVHNNHLQIVIADHAQVLKIIQRQDHVHVHKQLTILQPVIMGHAQEHIVIRHQEAVHVQLHMQEN